MNNEIILTTTLDEFIIALLRVHSPYEEYTISGTPDEAQRNCAHALQTKGLLTVEQSGAKQSTLRFTDMGLDYIRGHFDFGVVPTAGGDAPEEIAPATPRRRGPLGCKLTGVLALFAPLKAQTLTKKYKGKLLKVEIADDGSCLVDSVYYTSLSKAACAVTGQSHINGRKFFGVIKAAPAAAPVAAAEAITVNA